MIKKIKNFIKEKLPGQKKFSPTRPRVTPEQFREAGIAAKEKANELREFGKSLPGNIRILDAYGDFMDYTATEMERYGSTYGSSSQLNVNLDFTPDNFLHTLNWNVPETSKIEISLVTLSGVGTSVTGSIVPEIQKVARPNDPYFSSPPQNFVQLRLTDELTPLLDQLNTNFSPTWKSAWDSLVLERGDSLKNASVNARTVVDEISWLPDYQHLKTLAWCILDDKKDPIRAARYAWIRYGDPLPIEAKNDPSQDLYWKTFGKAYSELGKFVHKAEYDKTSRTQVEAALKSLEIGLIGYLKEGLERLKLAIKAKKK